MSTGLLEIMVVHLAGEIIAPPADGPRHVRQWASKFTWKLVGSSFRGEVLAFGEMLDATRTCCRAWADLLPGMGGFEDCESHSDHPKTKQTITEKFPARRSLGLCSRSKMRLPATCIGIILGLGNPAGRLTEVKSDVVPPSGVIGIGQLQSGNPSTVTGHLLQGRR